MTPPKFLVAVAAVSVNMNSCTGDACDLTLGSQGASCVGYSFCGLASYPPVVLNDSYPEPYLVAPPFQKVSWPGGSCRACTRAQAGANGYQFAPGRAVCAARCIPLALPGKPLSSAALDPAHPTMGVTVAFGGGDDGRELIHKVRCKAGAALKAVGLVTLPYTVHWEGDVGCGTPSSGCLPAPAPAIPTAEQLRWQDMEIGALIHFNMATTGGCKSASAFNPTRLDTDQWVEAFEAFGAREAVLVAKHGCGFVTWPSNATMPDGSRYNYSVASSSWMRGTGDVVASFKASCLKKGLGVGYYYSLGANSYTKGLHLTAEQLEAIEMQQMVELWSGRYGNEANLTEIWFDGGIDGGSRPGITALLKKLQPHAMAFNGCVVQGGGKQSRSTCITPNALRWIGTEAGVAPDPNWSSGFNKGGDPASDMFCPGESDTTLQNGDQWFHDANGGIRTLLELQDVYHGTVGHNSFLMMDFAPTPEGLIAADQAARYKEFGDWMRGCYYGAGVVATAQSEHAPGGSGGTSQMLVRFDTPRAIDRVVIREDQTQGQSIRGWEIQGQDALHTNPRHHVIEDLEEYTYSSMVGSHVLALLFIISQIKP